MIKNIIICFMTVLCVVLGYNSYRIEKYHNEIVELAIQDTSDSLLTYCEDRIEQICGK